MKKFLVLTLVLGMASLANASLIITTDYDGGDLKESDYITIGVAIPDQDNVMGYDLAIIVDGPATLDSADATIVFDKDWMNDPAAVVDELDIYRWTAGDVRMFGGTGQTGGDLLANLLFHCEGEGDVTVSLVSYTTDLNETIYGSAAAPYTFATLVVHQIPEPMTLALLGLGGLFLRRRK